MHAIFNFTYLHPPLKVYLTLIFFIKLSLMQKRNPPLEFCYFILIVIMLFGCIDQKAKHKKWYKGNLHTHSFWSDGDDFPEMIMDWYKRHGYHFVALSEHNIIAEGEKWIGMAEDTLYRNAFNRYLDKYGEDWVTYKEDSGRLSILLTPLDKYRTLFEEEEEFLIIPAEEITDKYEDKHLHLNATNLRSLIEPQHGQSVVEVLQNNINAVLEQRRITGQPMIVHINHPNFHYSISLKDMISLEGERFFEVFNGHPTVHNQGDSAHIGTEEMWDQVNIAYLDQGKPLIYGLGTDDSHHYHRQGKDWSNAGRGWIMVNAAALDAKQLISALEKGDFYASTGVELSTYSYRKNTISIGIKEQEGSQYSIEFIGCKKGDKVTQTLKKVDGTKARFTLDASHLFVRVRITSDRKHPNPIESFKYEMAWTQPVQYLHTKAALSGL